MRIILFNFVVCVALASCKQTPDPKARQKAEKEIRDLARMKARVDYHLKETREPSTLALLSKESRELEKEIRVLIEREKQHLDQVAAESIVISERLNVMIEERNKEIPENLRSPVTSQD